MRVEEGPSMDQTTERKSRRGEKETDGNTVIAVLKTDGLDRCVLWSIDETLVAWIMKMLLITKKKNEKNNELK